jgi:hypothetical protein
MLCIQFNQPKPTTFERRLAQEARSVKERAKTLPQGKERELLSRMARQLETASHISEWMSSPGLQPRRDRERLMPSDSIDARSPTSADRCHDCHRLVQCGALWNK